MHTKFYTVTPMKIKINQSKNIKVILFAALLCYGISASSTVSAQSITDLCKDKVRVEACKEGVKKTCDSKKDDEKSECQKNRAADFQIALLNPEKDSRSGRCGNTESGNSVETRINFGCLGNNGPKNMGAIEDLVYALVRFLSAGIGIAVVIFIILAGIQYSTSEGNPEQTQQAKNKIRDAIVGLIIYIFAFALVQYLVPGGVFAPSSMIVPDTIIHITRSVSS